MNILNSTFLGATFLNIIVWAVFGFVVGLVVHLLDSRHIGGGAWGTPILGIIGALLGGYLYMLFVGTSAALFSVSAFIASLVGALVLALLSRFIFPEEPITSRVGQGQYAYAGTKGGQAAQHFNDDGHAIVNPIQVEKYLKHVDYPATKDELLQAAQKEGADKNVMHTLEDLPNDTFEGPVGVSKAIGNLK